MPPNNARLQLAARELAEVAEGAGCRVLAHSTLDDGTRVWPVIEMECDDNAGAVRYLNDAAEHDAADPELRDLALRLGAAHTTPAALGEAVQRFVKATVRFVRETRETFQHALYTLKRGAGDCDDHARAVTALVRGAGHPGRLVGVKNSAGKMAHVAPLVGVDGRWIWAETTCDARFGEHPRSAAKRLGLTHARTDLFGERRQGRAPHAR
jgi:transglutaminase-like putative cysteine protease